jgi:S-DNA-T family DNA segregation ATPase FtsK/SpoIIIE
MRITVRTHDEERDVECVAAAGVPIGALLTALDLDLADEQTVYIDGRAVSANTPIGATGVLDGSIVEVITSGRDRVDPIAPVVELHQIGGLDSGSSLPLGIGRFDVGPAARHDTMVVRRSDAARLDIDIRLDGECVVTPGGSSRVLLDGLPMTEARRVSDEILIVDDRAFRFSGPLIRRRPEPDATAATRVRFERAPRVRLDEDALPAIVVPTRPEQPSRLPRLLAVSALPLVAGGVAGLVVDPKAYLIAALAPVIAVGWVLERMVRGRRRRRRFVRQASVDAQAFAQELDFHRAGAIQRRRVGSPDVAELRARALSAAPTIWERRSADPDFLRLAFGIGTAIWQPMLTKPIETYPELAPLVRDRATLPAVPRTIDLRSSRAVAVAGPRDDALAMARWLVVQIAALHGPADVALTLVCEPNRIDDWEWAKWLPHLYTDRSTPRVVTDEAFTPGISIVPIQRWRGARTAVFVVDGEPGTSSGSGGSDAALARAIADGGLAIVVVPSADRVPVWCSQVLHLEGRKASLAAAGETLVESVVATGISDSVARDIARALAALDDEADTAMTAKGSVAGPLQVRPFGLVAAAELPRRVPAHRR